MLLMGKSLWKNIRNIKPDLTFMDLTMPVMNGFQALEEILKFDPKAMVIILTADVQIKAVAKAHDLGAFSVLKKPPSKGINNSCHQRSRRCPGLAWVNYV